MSEYLLINVYNWESSKFNQIINHSLPKKIGSKWRGFVHLNS